MGVAANIWKMNGQRFLASFWLIAPMLVPYYEANGLSASDVYLIQAYFAGFLLLSEVPSGYISDVMGHKKTLIMASVFMPLGIVIYVLNHSFWGFVFAEVFLALNASLRSGTDSALLYNSLKDMEGEKDYAKVEGTAFFYQQAGHSLGDILGGVTTMVSLRFTFWINALTASFLLPLSLGLTAPSQKKQNKQALRLHVRDLVRAVKYCGRHKMVRYASIYLAAITGLHIFAYWSCFLFYGQIGIPVAWFGCVAAAGSFMGGVGAKLLPWFERRWGRPAALFVPLLAAPFLTTIGWMNNFGAMLFVFLDGIVWGFAIPLLRDILNEHARHHIRATVLSVEGMGERIVYIVTALVLGHFVEATSVQTGFILLGPILLACCAWPAYRLAKLTG
ncbi:MAG: MFS transporter [Bdellovibrionales bacterium]